MCINLSDINRAVTQHLLNIPYIDICLQKTGSKRMPEHMRCNMQVNGGECCIFADHPADGLICQLLSGLICKKMFTVFYFCGIVLPVLGQCVDNIIISNLYAPFFGAFSID